MTADHRLKMVIGEHTVQICILQDHLDQANAKIVEAQTRIKELEEKYEPEAEQKVPGK